MECDRCKEPTPIGNLKKDFCFDCWKGNLCSQCRRDLNSFLRNKLKIQQRDYKVTYLWRYGNGHENSESAIIKAGSTSEARYKYCKKFKSCDHCKRVRHIQTWLVQS